jgi:hypothetical protein
VPTSPAPSPSEGERLTPEQAQWSQHYLADQDHAQVFGAEVVEGAEREGLELVRFIGARTGAAPEVLGDVLGQIHDVDQGLARPAKDQAELYRSLDRVVPGKRGRDVVNEAERVVQRAMDLSPQAATAITRYFTGEAGQRRAWSPDVIASIWRAGCSLGWLR